MLDDDTTPDAAVQRAVWRRLGGPGRLELAMRMSDEARDLTRAGIAARQPDDSPEDVDHARPRMLLGDARFRTAGPTPSALHP